MRELVHQMLEELQEERVRGRLRKVKYVFDTGPLLLYFAGDERVGGFFEDVFRGEAEGYSPPVAQAPSLGLSG
ncbi:MAG: hypothetical protein QW753_03735 [Thermofilum sp.]